MTQDEINNEKKLKSLRIIKASNEMLQQAKENVIKHSKLTDSEKQERISQIDSAIDENNMRGKHNLGTDSKTINSLEYVEVSEEAKSKYKKYLEQRGITDEQLRQKEIATANNTATADTDTKKTRRRHKKEDNNVTVDQIPNEDELMKKSLIKSNDELETIVREKNGENPNKKNEVFKKLKENNKIKDKDEIEKSSADIKKEIKNIESHKEVIYDFDFSSIPDNIQYDVIPLPSNGECYSHHIGRIPVAYLTAADENIIASPNMYRDGKIIDVILERKILDKRIKVRELCQGDRDAIILWLRATGYGNDFPIVATHPDTEKKYNVSFDLSNLKYLDFKIKGDNNGYFDYMTDNGDKLKFKILSKSEEDALKNDIINNKINIASVNTIKYLNILQENIKNLTVFNDEDMQDLNDCMDDIRDIVNENVNNINSDENYLNYSNIITEQMKSYTMSVNGNTDRGYIGNYIDNMRSKEAYKYRNYVSNNKPGVNLLITINIPESDGGGSFETFLAINDSVFINI